MTNYITSTPVPLDGSDRILYDLPAAAEVLGGISVQKLRTERNAGRIVFTHIGRRCFVHRDELESYARHLPTV